MHPPASSDVGLDGISHRPGGSSRAPAEMTIGEVLTYLRPDFPDITISKIRFLESEGLIEPRRSPSGYRKFGLDDIARLRYVLTAQRDHYLPLRVIKNHLDAIDRGLEPPAVGLPGPRVPAAASADSFLFSDDRAGELRLSRAELLEASALTSEIADELEQSGLIAPREDGFFDADALAIARAVAELCGYGLEVRHLRPFKAAADREVGLIEQLVAPLLGAHRARADGIAHAVAALSVRLHGALVRSELRRLTAG